MLKGTLNGSYRSKNSGNKVYTYLISGTPAEIAALKAAKGDYYRETEKGEPLHFVTEFDAQGEKRIIEPRISLVITTNNNVVIDDTAAEQALMTEVKGHLGLEIAKQKAAAWIRKSAPVTTAPREATPAAQLITPEQLLEGATEGAGGGTETIAD